MWIKSLKKIFFVLELYFKNKMLNIEWRRVGKDKEFGPVQS